MTPLERIDFLKIEFGLLPDWEAKYLRLIEMGKALPPMEERLKTEQAKVKGCQSQVWLHAWLAEGRLHLQGDSDAAIVKGLVALLISVYSDMTPKEVLATPPDFLEQLGFKAHLSPSRANGLYAMLKQIKLFAMAYVMMEEAKNKTQ